MTSPPPTPESSRSLTKAFGICILAYVAAGVAALAVGFALRDRHPLVLVAAADVAATAVVFAFSVATNNSSMYDPYWSVAPIAIVAYWLYQPAPPAASLARRALIAALVVAWGARLTYNWARGWKGLGHEDWRYVNIRAKTGRGYWPASFFGIHLFPTVLVYFGCFALYPALVIGSNPIGVLDIVAAFVTAAAIWIEAAADAQLHRFRKTSSPGATLEAGLWGYSRHPNYFGEILFWWGLCLFGVAAGGATALWTVVGPLSITLLFVFGSIPMIERRMLERRPDYKRRRERVSALIPWPQRR
jgi:steroid 5-alpha reductase family enzyme